MTTATSREKGLLTALDVLLRAGHVEAARLIIAEVLDKELEEPGLEPFAALDDASFYSIAERVTAEARRREAVRAMGEKQ